MTINSEHRLRAGLSGGARHGCAALAAAGRLISVCPQERVTRVRGAGVNSSGVPDEALDLLLGRARRSREDLEQVIHAEGDRVSPYPTIAHHYAHALTVHLTSGFDTSAIVVCDNTPPGVTVWTAAGPAISRVDWPWEGAGFAELYSHCAGLIGFRSEGGPQRFEALARLRSGSRDAQVDRLLRLGDSSIDVSPSFDRFITDALRGGEELGGPVSATLAASVQARIAELFQEFLGRVKSRVGDVPLGIGGTFAYHSSMNTAADRTGLFERIFVPVDPGDAGLAAGAALHSLGTAPSSSSPFLGPAYSAEEIKAALDNCKLQYSWELEETSIAIAVKALREGRLVGWFDDAMEWGPRALGARSILAAPTSPYVLENLNRFLKHRESWRSYSLSGFTSDVAEYFEGPEAANFMEHDYHPREASAFRHVLPSPGAAMRVHTVSGDAPSRFQRLLTAFAEQSELPFLVNTSFNGFSEPIVCSPRDAIRVFYGTGIDVLIIGQFVVSK